MADISQADLKKGLRLIDEEQFPASESKTTQYGQHIADLDMIDAKNVMPTLEGYTSFFGVDSKLTSVGLPAGVEAQEIIGYRTLYGDALLIAFCSNGFYLRSLAGEETAVVTDVPASGNKPDHYTVDLPDGKGSWIKAISPSLGFLSPWKLWTMALFKNHLYFYAKGFDRIFRLTSYKTQQVVIEQLNPTYIIGTGKHYKFIVHSEEDSEDVTAGDLWKQIQINLTTGYTRAIAKAPLGNCIITERAPYEFINRLAQSAVATDLTINSLVKTDIDATITFTGTDLDIDIEHDGLPEDFSWSQAEVAGETVLTIGGYKDITLSQMNVTIKECPTAEFTLIFGKDGSEHAIVNKVNSHGAIVKTFDIATNSAFITAACGKPDLSVTMFSVEQESVSNDPRIFVSTDYGENYAEIGNATMDAQMEFLGSGKGMVWDGTYFWLIFNLSGQDGATWRSSDGINWTEMTSSETGLSSWATNAIHRLEYLNGTYYLTTDGYATGTRQVSTLHSTDCLTWSYLDDPSWPDDSQQNGLLKPYRVGSKNILMAGYDWGWTYEHTQIDSNMIRIKLNDSAVFKLKSRTEYKGKLVCYGWDETEGLGFFESADYGLIWSAIYLNSEGNTLSPYTDNGTTLNGKVLVGSATNLITVDSTTRHIHFSTDMTDWVDLGAVVDLTFVYFMLITSGFSINTTPGIDTYSVSIDPMDDSNELLDNIETAIDANSPCYNIVVDVTTPARVQLNYDIDIHLAFPNTTTIPSLTLTKNAATAFSETGSVTIEDVQLAHMEGITSAKGRLVIWDEDNLIYWGDAKSNPVDFEPSLETRANQLEVTSVLGKIVKCEGYDNGFIIYSTGNVVQGRYEGGTYTYAFKPIEGLNGIIDPRHVKTTLAAHYAWTNIGLVQIDPTAGQMQPIAPELTDWLSNYRYPITLGMLAGRFLVLYLQDRNLQFSNRLVRSGDFNPAMARAYLDKTEIEFTPATPGLNMYPTYTRALVYDTVLKHWGSADIDHKILFAIDPINQIGYKPEKDYDLFSAYLYNKQRGLGLLLPDNSIALASAFPDTSYLCFGKYAKDRDRQTKLTEVIAEFTNFPDAQIQVEKSIDGATLEYSDTVTADSFTDLRKVEGFNIAGQWLNVLIRGHYHLKRLLVKGYKYGRP